MFADLLRERLLRRKQENTYRVLRSIPEGATDLSSNDYLGLIHSGRLNELLNKQFSEYSTLTGAGGSRLISGDSTILEELESYIAAFYGSEAALTFSSGYDANLSLVATLGSIEGTTLLYDEKIHASMRDGFRLARARSYHFRHNDLEDLESHLKRIDGRSIVFVESVYSMDGDQAPLAELVQLLKKFPSELVVDEAHSVGVYGAKGEGLVSHLTLADDVLARVCTWGKAHGSQGAAIVSSQLLKDFLVNFARPFIYTTGISALIAKAALCSYTVVAESSSERTALFKLIEHFQTLTLPPFFQLSTNDSPIQTIQFTDGERQDVKLLSELASNLRELGFFIVPIFHPTVPKGAERIRISLHSFNSPEELRTLFSVLSQV
ncbi:MAG: pyridoxal phosphate-dependent aminotransferase family protein [Bdellovibrionales bacterium]|nr:pyridoxal phosphate-dependent aminotransferase family protein [Bdellovibrionales bacterium]